MKAVKRDKPSFSPFQISILIESEEDLRTLDRLIGCDQKGDCICAHDLEGENSILINAITDCLK